MGIAERVREIRSTLNLSQKDFGASIGAAPSTVGWYERGKIPEMGIKAICNYYNVREEWLLTGEGEIFQPPKPVEEDALIATLRERYRLSDQSVEILRGYFALQEEERTQLAELVHRLAEEVAAQNAAPQKNSPVAPPEFENLRRTG